MKKTIGEAAMEVVEAVRSEYSRELGVGYHTIPCSYNYDKRTSPAFCPGCRWIHFVRKIENEFVTVYDRS